MGTKILLMLLFILSLKLAFIIGFSFGSFTPLNSLFLPLQLLVVMLILIAIMSKFLKISLERITFIVVMLDLSSYIIEFGPRFSPQLKPLLNENCSAILILMTFLASLLSSRNLIDKI